MPCTDVTAWRRFFDLQAGTIWRDVAAEIARVHGTLLDVGCGAQPYRRLVPASASYIAIDTADAQTLFGYHAPDTRYYRGTRWPIEDESVDAVLATETLEHVLDPPSFLAEAFRCLRSPGRVILTVPFAARWHFIPADYWRFTPSGLKHLLEAAGFGTVVIRTRGNDVTVAAYKVMALLTPLLFPQRKAAWRALMYRCIGLLAVPLFLSCAIIGNLSLAWGSSDDCLGYTVLATKGEPIEHYSSVE
jgi:SAM-dependent methyltransferase